MKRNFLKIMMMALLPICVVSCVDNVPEQEILPQDAVSFEYYIDQQKDSTYYLDFYVDSDVTFINTSPESTEGEAKWDFGDGAGIVTGDTVIHSFAKAGTYNITLSIGDLSKKQVLMIAPIKPILTLKYADDVDVCEVRKTLVSFELELPNPKNKHAEFKWTFPKDTKTAADAEYATFESDTITVLPEAVKFAHVGSQEVRLEVTLGGETLETVIKNVQVGYDQEVPTLYYAVQGGRIMAYKLTNGQHPEGMEVSPFDLGVASGQHPFNILFSDSLLYVLDAGKQFYFVDDANGVLGDGKISVVAKDGSKVQTMISNAGQAAFDDPFYGCIDGDVLYYANRNTGIIKVPLKDRDKMYNTTEYPYYVNHNTLGYYNNGIAYGAIGGTIGKIDGTWYWAKFYNANGIFRFKDADILPEAITQGDDSNKPASGVLIPGTQAKSFVYASKSQKLCFTIMDAGNNGFYCASIADIEAAGSSKTKLADYEKKYNDMSFACNTTGNLPAVEGTGSESVGICQMAYDAANDCVYFAFRNNSAQKDLYPATGIYCYNVATETFTCLIEGVSVYGITINPTPSKLF